MHTCLPTNRYISRNLDSYISGILVLPEIQILRKIEIVEIQKLWK